MAPAPLNAPSLKQNACGWKRHACAIAALLLAARPAAAQQIALAPPSDQLGYTAYVFGLLPVPASFSDFTGILHIDPAHPAQCAVHVTVQIASLRMADPARRAQALGPAMLNAAQYPNMVFEGACTDLAHLSGRLTLHGVTRPLTLALHRLPGQVQATGVIHRRDFGILGLPNLVGAHIRVRLSVALPQTPSG